MYVINSLNHKCDLKQQYQRKIVFGDGLSIDVIFLKDKVVLHFVDTTSRFFAATFLDSRGMSSGKSVQGIWLALVMMSCLVYMGYSIRLRIDQRSFCTSDHRRKLFITSKFQIRPSVIKAHDSLGAKNVITICPVASSEKYDLLIQPYHLLIY